MGKETTAVALAGRFDAFEGDMAVGDLINRQIRISDNALLTDQVTDNFFLAAGRGKASVTRSRNGFIPSPGEKLNH